MYFYGSVFLLFLFPQSIAGLASQLKCNTGENANLYSHMAYLDSGTYSDSRNCYFIVKDASYMVYVSSPTQDDRLDQYRADLDLGRIICFQHQATLPIVLTESEHNFLNKEYANDTHFIMLSLERMTYDDYIWDNMLATIFKPAKWVQIEEKTSQTTTMMMTNDGRWSEFYPNKTWPKKQRFPVICHQREWKIVTSKSSLPGVLGSWHPNSTRGSVARHMAMVEYPGPSGAETFSASILAIIAALSMTL